VHLLFNNAGVESIGDLLGPVWESPLADWEWIIGVNLWGVIHGCRVFVPLMLEQETECHIVNTASAAGLIASPVMGIYKVTKHGVVTLSETLYLQLMQRGAKLGVSVVCPGSVQTQILDSAPGPTPEDMSPEDRERLEVFRRNVLEGMSPAQVADCVFDAIRESRFYILTHSEVKDKVRIRMEDILEERNPTMN
jgi:short-subunit dehydrogenase